MCRKLLLLALVVGLLGASCGQTASPDRSPSGVPSQVSATETATTSLIGGGTFRYGIGEPTTIVPPLVRMADDQAVVDALFDSLTSWNAAGEAVPAAAVDWTSSADSMTWTFRLRAGATFHDGTPITSAAFAQAWALLVSQGSLGYLLADVVGYERVSSGQIPGLAGVRTPDDTTLVVSLLRPRADLPIVLGHPALGPVPLRQMERDPDGWTEEPVGNGPFLMTEPWAHGDFIRASAWSGWTNGGRAPGGAGEVLFRIGDQDINFLAFRQGGRDFTAVPLDALTLAADLYPSEGGEFNGPGLIVGGRPEVYLLQINPAVPPYTDLAVRQAVSLVIDRVALARVNEGGNLVPSRSLLPPGLPGLALETCDLCTFNPSGASSRLQTAGVTQLTFAYNSGGGHERIRDVLRRGLSDIGVSLVSNSRGPAPALPDYQARLEGGGVGLFRVPLVMDVPSILTALYPILHGSQVPESGGLNYMRYDDPTVNSLLDQAARTLDAATRNILLRRVEDIALNRDHVLVPLFSYRHAMVASDRVRGLRYGPFGLLNLTDLVLDG